MGNRLNRLISEQGMGRRRAAEVPRLQGGRSRFVKAKGGPCALGTPYA